MIDDEFINYDYLGGFYKTKANKFEILDNYIIGYTEKGNKFYFDKDYHDSVSKHYWICKSDKNIVTYIDNKQVNLSMFIFHTKCRYLNGNIRDCRSDNIVTIASQRGLKRININGYIEIYMPEHHRAFKSSGCVYEHILVAEKMLNRSLLPEEVVHHIDKDRSNNLPNNLMVFASNADHTSFHGGGDAIKQDDGTYICKNKQIDYSFNRKYNLCPKCKENIKTISAARCIKCYEKELKEKSHIPTKDILENLIYNTSFEAIGREYGVTGNTIKKWCKKYNLPHTKKDIRNNMA